MLSFYIPLDPLSRLGLTSSQCPTIQQRHTFRPGIPSRHKIETRLGLRLNHLLHHDLRHKRRIPQPARESLSLVSSSFERLVVLERRPLVYISMVLASE
jgi:hypothetical protein